MQPGAAGIATSWLSAGQRSFQIAIDPVEKLVGKRSGDIVPEPAFGIGPTRQIEQRDKEVIEQFGGLVWALRRLHSVGYLRLGYRRGRDAAWEKRARSEIATPDVIDAQQAGRYRALGPPT